MDRKDYQGAKAKIDRFYNSLPEDPTELQIIEKYEVDKINRRVVQAIEQEDRLYQQVKSTKSVSRAREYLNNYPYGKYRSEIKLLLADAIEDEEWQKAKDAKYTSAYYKYVDAYPNGKYTKEAMETIRGWDKAAYNKAIDDGSVTALNYYLDNYPRGEYRDEVRNKMNLKKETDLYEYAVKTNLITDYESYISRYPNGIYAERVNSIIENSYFAFGNNDFKAKEWYKAKEHYNKYLQKYPNGRYAGEANSQLKKIQRKLNQRSASYMMYTWDTESPIGIEFGGLNVNTLGTYLNIKLKPSIFTGFDVLYKIDDSGEHDSPWDVLIPTDSVREANIAASFGITIKIAYPLWIYAGAGLGYYPYYEEFAAYYTNSSGSKSFNEYEFLRNTDRTRFSFFPEGGVKLKVGNALVLKYGIMHNKALVHQLGLGIQI